MADITEGQRKKAIVLCILKMITGAIIALIAFISIRTNRGTISLARWIGIIYLISGIVGNMAAIRRYTRSIVSFLVFDFVLFILIAVGLIIIFNTIAYCAEDIKKTNCTESEKPKEYNCTYMGKNSSFTDPCSSSIKQLSELWGIAAACLLTNFLLLASSILGFICYRTLYRSSRVGIAEEVQ